MRRLAALLCAMSLLTTSLMHSGLLRAEDAGPQPIRIATEGAYPPFNFVDANGALQGFEIDLARALCAEMKADCTFNIVDWDALIPDLRAGKIDAIMASMEITPERSRKISFSRPYYRTPAVFMAREDTDITDVTPEGLKGRSVGAMAETPYASFLEAFYKPGTTISLYGSQDDASLDLALGRIDLVLGDKIALAEWLKRGKEAACCRFLADAPDPTHHFGKGFGVGLRKADVALRERFDAAIAAVQANGVYDAIRMKYFTFDIR